MFFIAFITVFYCCCFLVIFTQWSSIYNTTLLHQCTNLLKYLDSHDCNIASYTLIHPDNPSSDEYTTILIAANFVSYGVPKNTTANVHTICNTKKNSISTTWTVDNTASSSSSTTSLGSSKAVLMSFLWNDDSIGSKSCAHVCSLVICSCLVMIFLYIVSMFSVVLLTVNSFPLKDHQHKRGL